MSDVLPNYQTEQQRLRSAITAQKSVIEAQVLSILEMVEKKKRHIENISAATKAIQDYEAKLDGLKKEHGSLTDELVQELINSL